MKEYVRRYTLEEAKALIDKRKFEGEPAERWTLSNNLIKDVKLDCVGHFGGAIVLDLVFQEWFSLYGLINTTANIGLVLRELALFLGVVEDDRIDVIKALKDQPVRLFVLNYTDRSAAELAFIGHFMEDKFIWFADLANIPHPQSKDKAKKNRAMNGAEQNERSGK